MRIFGLKRNHLQGVPILHTIPDDYFVGGMARCLKPLLLVSVKTVKRIAIAVHGSEAALEQLRSGNYKRTTDRNMSRWLKNAPLEPLAQNPSKQPTRANKPSDKFCGMGSIKFSSMSYMGKLQKMDIGAMVVSSFLGAIRACQVL
jgi:hypothetical protein